MESLIHSTLNGFNSIILLVVLAFFLWLLGKGADLVVEESVSISLSWGIPKIIVGSTIVSLGTTLPEASVSVMAAIKGTSGLALGNAIGSIIADTGLILGLSAIIGLIPVKGETIKKQSNFQIIAVILLALACLPYKGLAIGGHVERWMGFIFVILLISYILYSIFSTKGSINESENEELSEKNSFIKSLFILAIGIFLIIVSSKILIPSVQILATRVGIPESIIGATLIAFGTSLPELITSVTAVRKGHGEIAIGNIIGADILNVLFVIGVSASVTKTGLSVPKEFLLVQIPFMLAVVFLLKFSIKKSKENIPKTHAFLLLGLYIVYIVLTFAL